MEMTNSEEERKLLQSQAHIWNHMCKFIKSISLKCAVELGIPDVVNSYGQAMPLSKLVAALPINPSKGQHVHRLMRMLVHSGFFTKERVSEEEEGYMLTPVSRLLLKDEPFSLVPFLSAMFLPVMLEPFYNVSEWFKNDNNDPTPFHMTHGKSVWEFVSNDPRANHFFNEGMASDAQLVASQLVNSCKGVFEGLNSLVDVAGGTGTAAKALAGAFPNMKCTVLDLPHVVAGLRGSKNLNYVGGNMFEAIPPADAIVLKSVLHDWNHEDSVKILKRCKEAIPSRGGKVIIIDIIVDQQKEDHEKSLETKLLNDMMMMINVSGTERTEQDWAKLFVDAGFSDYKIITPILGLRSLIEAYP